MQHAAKRENKKHLVCTISYNKDVRDERVEADAVLSPHQRWGKLRRYEVLTAAREDKAPPSCQK